MSVAVSSPSKTADVPSPSKLQVYEERDADFGTSPKGTARTGEHRIKKFCVDHLGVDTPSDDMLREIFNYFDADKSGQIDKNEFRKVYAESFDNYGVPNDSRDIDRLFAHLDRDNSGKLSYDEFCVLMLNRLKA